MAIKEEFTNYRLFLKITNLCWRSLGSLFTTWQKFLSTNSCRCWWLRLLKIYVRQQSLTWVLLKLQVRHKLKLKISKISYRRQQKRQRWQKVKKLSNKKILMKWSKSILMLRAVKTRMRMINIQNSSWIVMALLSSRCNTIRRRASLRRRLFLNLKWSWITSR